MKNNIKLFGIIAVTAIISLLMLGCPKEPEEAGVSLPSAPKITDAPAFPSGVTFVGEGLASPEGRDAALELFKKVTGSYLIGSSGGTSFSKVYEDAFAVEYKKIPATSPTAAAGNRQGATLNFSGEKPSDDIAGLKIKGTTSGSRTTSGVNLIEYAALGLTKKGDSRTTKRSADITFEFKEWIKAASGTRYDAGGVLKVKSSDSVTRGWKEGTGSDRKYTENDSEEYKYSFVLTVIDTQDNKGAKYRFSYAEKGKDTERKASYSDYYETGTLEVYNDANVLQYTFNTGLPSGESVESSISSLSDSMLKNWSFGY